MDEGQAIHKNGHIITGAVHAPVFLVLIDDLQAVVVDVFFIQQTDVFRGAVVAVQKLDGFGLDPARLFCDSLIFAGNALGKKATPFTVNLTDRKSVV